MHQPLHVKVNEKQRFVCLGNILHHKSVRAKVPSYFKDQSVPIISYPYTSRIALTIFKHRRLLQDFSIDYITAKPPDCSCHHSPCKPPDCSCHHSPFKPPDCSCHHSPFKPPDCSCHHSPFKCSG